jgi:hypothetical protein
MAIFSSTLMTRGKGSIGNLTIVTSKGRMIAKQKISIMSNPKTAKQTIQRNALALAVALWQHVGSVIKSGITVYPEFGSQYSGFVKSNIEFLKGSTANPKNVINENLAGLQASNGTLGTITATVDDLNASDGTFVVPAGSLRNIAKVGDLLKVVVGAQTGAEMGYFEKVVTADDLLASNDSLVFSGNFYEYAVRPVYAIWVESADGVKSSSSKFLQG